MDGGQVNLNGKEVVTTEQINRKLREAEVELARGRTVSRVCKQISITDQTLDDVC